MGDASSANAREQRGDCHHNLLRERQHLAEVQLGDEEHRDRFVESSAIHVDRGAQRKHKRGGAVANTRAMFYARERQRQGAVA